MTSSIDANKPRITAAILTFNRHDWVLKAYQSLASLDSCWEEILVFDNGSTPPLRWEDLIAACPALAPKTRLMGVAVNTFPLLGRQQILDEAKSDLVFHLDDDAELIPSEDWEKVFRLVSEDKSIGAIAIKGYMSLGQPCPDWMQPSKGTYPCECACYIGYAMIHRRSAVARVGGLPYYLFYFGEEQAVSMRMWNEGYRVLYWPSLGVVHHAVPAGRDFYRGQYLVLRNRCLNSLRNDPGLLIIPRVAWSLWISWRALREKGGGYRRVWGAVGKDLWQQAPEMWRLRNPVRWSTLWHWRKVRRYPPLYTPSLGDYEKKHRQAGGLFAWSHRRRFQRAVELAHTYGRGRLLDYGCGDGTFLRLLLEHGGYPAERVGAEVDGGQIQDCQDRLRFLPDTRFVPVTELKQEGKFQIIFCLEVLEHVVELDKILDQLRYLLEPDGRLVISVPVEMGVTLAIKQAARRLTAWRGNRDYAETERYTLGEFLCGLMGGKVLRPIYTDPAGFRYHGHKGFDWRELRRALNAQFELVEESVTPLPWLPSQHWLVLKPR